MDLNLIQCISEFTDLKTCLKIVCMCKWTVHNIKIKYVNDKYLYHKITDHILQHKRCSHLMELNINNNQKVTKISQLCNLQKLYIAFNCGVTDDEIKNLNLIELYAHSNSKINKINRMTNLQKIDIGYNCGVTDNEIKNLNLIKINAYGKLKIKKETLDKFNKKY